ncbi:hypothetical protein ANCDUO_26871, partial [Ancylostoma duodenale]
MIVSFSSGESSDSDDDSNSGQLSVWIGNDDGEVFVVNSTERVRTRARERVARLTYPVTAITAVAGYVFVATAKRSWELDSPTTINHSLTKPILAMCQVGRRLVLASGPQIHALDTEGSVWE